MAKCSFASPIAKAHGKVGNSNSENAPVALTSRRCAGVLRQNVKQNQPNTVAQQTSRARTSAVSAFFKGLSKENADAWATAADTIKKQNILGVPYRLTGPSLFSAVNSFRDIANEFYLENPPENIIPPVSPITLTKFEMSQDGFLMISGECPNLPDGSVIAVRISSDLGSQARQAGEELCRFYSPTSSNNLAYVSPSGFSLNFAPVADGLSIGDRVGVHLTPLTEDFLPGKPVLIGNIGVSVYTLDTYLCYDFKSERVDLAAPVVNFIDVSDNGKAATNLGTTYDDGPGIVDQGKELFGGSLAQIAFGTRDFTLGEPWTCGAWINPLATSTNSAVFGTSTNGNSQCGVANGSQLLFRCKTGVTTLANLSASYVGRTLLVTFTSDGSGLKMFENGTKIYDGSPPSVEFAPNRIGVGGNAAGHGFNGYMDNAFLIERELSEAEVAALHSQGPLFPLR